MGHERLEYTSPMYQARERKQKTKREQAADLINEGRRLAREALDEENLEAAMVAEYGPRTR